MKKKLIKPIFKNTSPYPLLNIQNLKQLTIDFENNIGTYIQEVNGNRISGTVSFIDGIRIRSQFEVEIKKSADYEMQVVWMYETKKLTQQQIAKELGISQATISRILTQRGFGRK
ncbi:MAG: sigma factor-like helix-turn-helix DNA-binding protein [Bacillota bacterium]